jgi:hypothetical protein
MAEAAIRTKGGVCLVDGQYYVLIDIWDNAQCEGEPLRIMSVKGFPTEAAALRHYIAKVRPKILSAHEQLAKDIGGSVSRRNIFERGTLEDYLR